MEIKDMSRVLVCHIFSSKCILKSDNIVLKENGLIINKPEEVCKIFRTHFVT